MSPSLRGHHGVLGEPRARFRMHWPWFLWAVVWLLPLPLAGLVLATGSPGAAMALLVILMVAVSLPLTWFLRRHQLVLTDRAIVMGAFLPAVSPDVVFYADIEAPTVRTWSNLRAYLRSAGTSSFRSGHLLTEGSGLGVTWRARRTGRLRNGVLQEEEVVAHLGGTVEMFALGGSAESFVGALGRLMTAARVPGAEHLMRTALPPGRLSGARGSHRTEIPGWPARRQPRAQDLPPRVRQRLRGHGPGG